LRFLQRDATQSAVMPHYATQYVVRLPVRLCVTFRYIFHTSWNNSKIIPLRIGLRFLLGLTTMWAITFNGTSPKLGWNRVGVLSKDQVMLHAITFCLTQRQ